MKFNIPEGKEIDLEKSSLEKGEIFFKDKEVEGVKKWEDLGEVKGFFINKESMIHHYKGSSVLPNKNISPTKQDAESSLALAQLLQLRKRDVGYWVADWSKDNDQDKFIIEFFNGEIGVDSVFYQHQILSFPNKKMAETFLSNHKELIEIYFQIK